jgi:hypothetical protein
MHFHRRQHSRGARSPSENWNRDLPAAAVFSRLGPPRVKRLSQELKRNDRLTVTEIPSSANLRRPRTNCNIAPSIRLAVTAKNRALVAGGRIVPLAGGGQSASRVIMPACGKDVGPTAFPLPQPLSVTGSIVPRFEAICARQDLPNIARHHRCAPPPVWDLNPACLVERLRSREISTSV